MNTTKARENGTAASAQPLREQLEISVRSIGIPPRPAVLAEVDAEMRRDDPDYRRINEIIGADVGLAAAVIKVANSAYFGMGRHVRNVPDALLVLGLRLTVHTIAGIILQRVFPNVPSLEDFWDSSARRARVSRWLAQQLRKRVSVHPDDAYTCGLFQDCGIPLIMGPFPDYAAVLTAANADAERCFTDIEDEAMAINHATFGAELAEEWGLPPEACQAIRHHHDRNAIAGAGGLPQPARELIGLGHLADHLIESQRGRITSHEWDKLGSAVLGLFALDAEGLDDLRRESADVATAAL